MEENARSLPWNLESSLLVPIIVLYVQNQVNIQPSSKVKEVSGTIAVCILNCLNQVPFQSNV